MRCVTAFVLLAYFAKPLLADGPADNNPATVRRIPKLGVEVSSEKRQEIEAGLAKLATAIDKLKAKKDARTKDLLPDVQVYHKAVQDALKYQEFFDEKDVNLAAPILREGQLRADQLLAGEAPWNAARGLVVRGYVSKIDGSVQPYGLVIPESYQAGSGRKYRLDSWFHGRGETLSELNFVQQRRTQVGTFSPADTIVLHPYGRYSNANKFAGEIDLLEALESVKSRYAIDEDRIAVRGFSMGGAACWQFAVHYPDRWFAANPGAGFAETPEFLKSFQQETLDPPWYERKLWRLYDCVDWAANLAHCPTVAYSGEIDKQKQAADIMAEALRREGMELLHVIGPKTAHAYHPEARKTVDKLMDSIAVRGRERVPRNLHFVTYTLRYDRSCWVQIDRLKEHWEQARVDAEIANRGEIVLKTQNVAAMTLYIPAGYYPLDMTQSPGLTVDGQRLVAPPPLSDKSWRCALNVSGGKWSIGEPKDEGLVKKHGLQGPIDDAFMDSFLFVRPTGKTSHAAVDAWAKAELERAIEHWRRHFRGEARVKDDVDVTQDDIAANNLVLWGDAESNSLIKQTESKLPIRVEGDQLVVGDRKFAAEHHAPILVYPNPLNPERYVVLNSGFTFREYDYLNNARQVPKLPDWAIVDVRTPPGTRYAGKIVDADFFGERWELRPAHGSAGR